jgi:hypothetical protein
MMGLPAYFLGNRGGKDAMLFPETFISKKSKKGVYYNPYFTINDADC